MEQYEAFKRIREAEAKSDLIGAIHNSEMYELLGFHKVITQGEKESWDNFMASLSSEVKEKVDEIGELAVMFGNEREETGFRIGFHTAMRLCMEGLNGGVR